MVVNTGTYAKLKEAARGSIGGQVRQQREQRLQTPSPDLKDSSIKSLDDITGHWQEFLMTEEIMADILAGTLNLGLMGTFLKKLLSPRFRNEVMNMPLAGIEAIFSSTDLHEMVYICFVLGDRLMGLLELARVEKTQPEELCF
ncbi:hypothetical protein VPH35_060852 [Triticum aestivum]|uniref:Uncharacterized protein n=1 Tax=Aegilops tauschii TaxID=37682 RepID=M8BXE7_AEGTA